MSLLQILLLAMLSLTVLYATRALLRFVFVRAIQDAKLKTRNYYLAHGLSVTSGHYYARMQRLHNARQAFSEMSFLRVAIILSHKKKISPSPAYQSLVDRAKTGNKADDRVLNDYIDGAWYYMICGCMLTSSIFWVLLIPSLCIIIANHWTIQKAKKRIEPLQCDSSYANIGTFVPA